jgi:hypothetical protein
MTTVFLIYLLQYGSEFDRNLLTFWRDILSPALFSAGCLLGLLSDSEDEAVYSSCMSVNFCQATWSPSEKTVFFHPVKPINKSLISLLPS